MSIFKLNRQLFNTTLTIFTVVAVLCINSACKPPQKQSGPPEKITIAYSTAPNAILVDIAFANEYFKEEGLDATSQPHAFGKLALNALIEGKADLATVGDTPLVLSIMVGEKLSTIAVIQRSSTNEAIVARQDRGIMKPVDLKGKKIGVTFGTTGDFFADSFLVVHGIKRNQVRLIDMKPDEMAGALDTGRVDAVSTWNPTLRQLGRDLGNKGITFYGGEFYTETFCLAGSREYIQKHPDAINKVLRALIKAQAFAKQRPDDARRLVANFIKTDKSVLDEIWDIFNLRVTLDQALLLNFEEQSRWAVKNRLIPDQTIPNYLDFIYVEGLQTVKPEAVRIIR